MRLFLVTTLLLTFIFSSQHAFFPKQVFFTNVTSSAVITFESWKVEESASRLFIIILFKTLISTGQILEVKMLTLNGKLEATMTVSIIYGRLQIDLLGKNNQTLLYNGDSPIKTEKLVIRLVHHLVIIFDPLNKTIAHALLTQTGTVSNNANAISIDIDWTIIQLVATLGATENDNGIIGCVNLQRVSFEEESVDVLTEGNTVNVLIEEKETETEQCSVKMDCLEQSCDITARKNMILWKQNENEPPVNVSDENSEEEISDSVVESAARLHLLIIYKLLTTTGRILEVKILRPDGKLEATLTVGVSNGTVRISLQDMDNNSILDKQLSVEINKNVPYFHSIIIGPLTRNVVHAVSLEAGVELFTPHDTATITTDIQWNSIQIVATIGSASSAPAAIGCIGLGDVQFGGLERMSSVPLMNIEQTTTEQCSVGYKCLHDRCNATSRQNAALYNSNITSQMFENYNSLPKVYLKNLTSNAVIAFGYWKIEGSQADLIFHFSFKLLTVSGRIFEVKILNEDGNILATVTVDISHSDLHIDMQSSDKRTMLSKPLNVPKINISVLHHLVFGIHPDVRFLMYTLRTLQRPGERFSSTDQAIIAGDIAWKTIKVVVTMGATVNGGLMLTFDVPSVMISRIIKPYLLLLSNVHAAIGCVKLETFQFGQTNFTNTPAENVLETSTEQCSITYDCFREICNKTAHQYAMLLNEAEEPSRIMEIFLFGFMLFVLGILLATWNRLRLATSVLNPDNLRLEKRHGFPMLLNDLNDYNELEKEMLRIDYEKLFNEMCEELKITVESLRFEEEIGRGQFGIVYKATQKTNDGDILKVACKILRRGTRDDEEINSGISGVEELFNEGITMGQLKHERIVQLIGIAFTECKVPIIVTEYVAKGDLEAHLRDNTSMPSLDQLMDFAIEIAEGMEYLHLMSFIHRDLAARNCMLDISMHVKIADFGLARKCNEDELYATQQDCKMPFRWMPLEALANTDGNFTFQGDIWSYGVVLWELLTRCRIPYEAKNYLGVREFLRHGGRLDKPEHCPTQL